MSDIRTFLVSFICTICLFYTFIPNQNPYRFPKPGEIDKYMYVDDNGICYKYIRKYITDGTI